MKTTPKPFVFVLMPFAASFNDLYQLGIKAACENVGAYAERVDEQLFQESILERIYNQISKADVIIADTTGQNPNVFYEIGYAHALGKTVILITKEVKDIPFDLQHYPHVIHEGSITSLIPKLEKFIRWAIENPATSASLPIAQLRFFHHGEDLNTFPRHTLTDVAAQAGFYLKIDIHNSIERRIQLVKFQIAIVSNERVTSIFDNSTDQPHPDKLIRVHPPEGGNIFVLRRLHEILPGSWESILLYLNIEPRLKADDSLDIGLRVFCEGMIGNYQIRVEYRPPETETEGSQN